MKRNFNIGARTGLLDQKHMDSLGSSIWLYLWFLDKQPKDTEKVLGGKPVTYQMFADSFPSVPRATYIRWLAAIEKGGYISLLRTPRGYVVSIKKAKKWVKSDVTSMQHLDVSPVQHHNKSDVAFMDSDVAKTQHAEDVAKTQHPIKRDSLDMSIERQIYTSTDVDTFDLKTFFYELVTKLGFTDSVKFTDGRKLKLKARLKTYKADEILKASELIGSDAFLQGDNPSGKRYGDIDYLLRSDEQIDKQLQKVINKVNYKADW